MCRPQLLLSEHHKCVKPQNHTLGHATIEETVMYESENIRKKRRISTSKSKNGCKTCKTRRVKCDERKPSCSRCEKGNYDCDGYEIKSSLPEGVILPRIMANFQPIIYQPRKTIFRSDREQEYFRIFCDQMAPQMSGHFNSDLWGSLVLQACEVDTSIRRAIIALAALNSTSELCYARENMDLEMRIDAQKHHQFAIRQYSKAIQSMRQAALMGNQDLRTMLISCIVIVCFETFHGNHKSAAKQIMIGLDIIESKVFGKKEVDRSMPRVEEELIRAFERLDIQAMSFIDPRAAQRHRSLKDVGKEKIEKMPDKFESVEEARDFLELVMRRSMHSMASLLPDDCTSGLLKVDISLCIPDEHLGDRDKHLDELRRWYSAFLPILIHARESSNRGDFLRATSLELQYLAAFFSSSVIQTSLQGLPDTRTFMPIFERIVSGAEAILEDSDTQGRAIYVFEIQVVCHLYAVAWRCPQRTLRRKAISLLLSRPRREGLWCASMAGNLAAWIMSLEEERFEGEYAPEDIRVTCVDVLDFNMANRNARVSCRVPHNDGWVPQETVIYW